VILLIGGFSVVLVSLPMAQRGALLPDGGAGPPSSEAAPVRARIGAPALLTARARRTQGAVRKTGPFRTGSRGKRV